jgi:hypothetical protein
MNYPDEGLEVLILNPNTNDWEFAYHKNDQWWQGVPDDPNDKLVDFIPSKWKYRYE